MRRFLFLFLCLIPFVAKAEYVSSYTRNDGTGVSGYYRQRPTSATYVNPYVKRDGTYVSGHYRQPYATPPKRLQTLPNTTIQREPVSFVNSEPAPMIQPIPNYQQFNSEAISNINDGAAAMAIIISNMVTNNRNEENSKRINYLRRFEYDIFSKKLY